MNDCAPDFFGGVFFSAEKTQNFSGDLFPPNKKDRRLYRGLSYLIINQTLNLSNKSANEFGFSV